MRYNEMWQQLCPPYDPREAQAVVRLLLEMKFGLSMMDLICGAAASLPEAEITPLLARLQAGEPVQHVMGEAEFGPRRVLVNGDVLIPRPETFALCQWILQENELNKPLHALDIGTGSGCIACTLAAERPAWQVDALDVSAKALAVARQNAARWQVDIHFIQGDALALAPEAEPRYELMVSNPPYICQRERAAMEPLVLLHEPSEALFVPDHQPLLFYEAIARYAATALTEGGKLYFEINTLYLKELKTMLAHEGFEQIEVRLDPFDKPRFVRCFKTSKP